MGYCLVPGNIPPTRYMTHQLSFHLVLHTWGPGWGSSPWCLRPEILLGSLNHLGNWSPAPIPQILEQSPTSKLQSLYWRLPPFVPSLAQVWVSDFEMESPPLLNKTHWQYLPQDRVNKCDTYDQEDWLQPRVKWNSLFFKSCRGNFYHLLEQILCHNVLEGITTSSAKSIPQLGFLQSLCKALLDKQFSVEEILTVK